MGTPRAHRFLIRTVAWLGVSAVWLTDYFGNSWINVALSAAIFIPFTALGDIVFHRSLVRLQSLPDGDMAQFAFPQVTDEDLRAARVRSFYIGAIIAILPALFNAFWRWFDDGVFIDVNLFKQSLPDFAIAGVGITISAYTSSVFSIARLEGRSTTGGTTFVCLFLGTICALICFVAYLRATHAPPQPALLRTLFFSSLALMIASFAFSYFAVLSFVSDELRYARIARRTLPAEPELVGAAQVIDPAVAPAVGSAGG